MFVMWTVHGILNILLYSVPGKDTPIIQLKFIKKAFLKLTYFRCCKIWNGVDLVSSVLYISCIITSTWIQPIKLKTSSVLTKWTKPKNNRFNFSKTVLFLRLYSVCNPIWISMRELFVNVARGKLNSAFQTHTFCVHPTKKTFRLNGWFFAVSSNALYLLTLKDQSLI